MDTQIKTKIIEAANKWLSEMSLLPVDLALKSGVNKSYISAMLGGQLSYKSGKNDDGTDKMGIISDKMFVKIAEVVGYNLELSFWEHVNTEQYKKIVSNLNNARILKRSKMIIGETGCGKTYAINKYARLFPKDTIVVTVMDDDKVTDILEQIAKLLDIELPRLRRSRIRCIADKIKDLSKGGRKLLLIIDEAENTKVAGIKAYKAIYDLTRGYCGFVLIGTEELPIQIDRFQRYGKGGMPQFLSRFNVGEVKLGRIDRSFNEFLLNKVADPQLRITLTSLCRDYRMLNDYLEPAFYEANKRGEELTDEFFKKMYEIKNNKEDGKD